MHVSLSREMMTKREAEGKRAMPIEILEVLPPPMIWAGVYVALQHSQPHFVLEGQVFGVSSNEMNGIRGPEMFRS